MLKFWLSIMKRTPAIAWQSTHHLEAVFGVIGFVVLLVVPLIKSVEDAEAVPHWFAVHYLWLWVPVIGLFAHLVMKAVYEKYRDVEIKCDRLRSELEQLVEKKSQLKLEVASLYEAGCALASRPVATELEFDGWKYQLFELELKIRHWVTANFGLDEAAMALGGTFQVRNILGKFNDEHNKLVNQIQQVYLPALQDLHRRLRKADDIGLDRTEQESYEPSSTSVN